MHMHITMLLGWPYIASCMYFTMLVICWLLVGHAFLLTDTISISFGQYLSGPEIFSLNLTDHHQLILNSPLDFETSTNYSFTIEAAEVATTSGTNLFTSTATVVVQVMPVNEYPPVIMPTIRLV